MEYIGHKDAYIISAEEIREMIDDKVEKASLLSYQTGYQQGYREGYAQGQFETYRRL